MGEGGTSQPLANNPNNPINSNNPDPNNSKIPNNAKPNSEKNKKHTPHRPLGDNPKIAALAERISTSVPREGCDTDAQKDLSPSNDATNSKHSSTSKQMGKASMVSIAAAKFTKSASNLGEECEGGDADAGHC